ncbi:MAG: hypothetical protein VX730_06795 [Pseudomonadota bacterium]|nr:hypothetical protein [Pseudomonadota bacterium]
MPRFFRLENSAEQILVIHERSKQLVFFSPDGKTFQALKTTHIATQNGIRVLTLQGPNTVLPPMELHFSGPAHILFKQTPDDTGTVYRYHEHLSLAQVTLLPLPSPTPTMLKPPLEAKKLELRHFFRVDAEIYIAVTSYAGESYSQFKYYIGKLGEPMDAMERLDISVARDGGSTWVKTDQGDLYWPSSLHAGSFGASLRPPKSPTWNNEDIARENVSQYDVLPSGDTITVFHASHKLT